MLAKKNGDGSAPTSVENVIKKTWDSNVITPGTPFMDILATSLRYWVAYKLNTDPAWEKVRGIWQPTTVTDTDSVAAESHHFGLHCSRRGRA